MKTRLTSQMEQLRPQPQRVELPPKLIYKCKLPGCDAGTAEPRAYCSVHLSNLMSWLQPKKGSK